MWRHKIYKSQSCPTKTSGCEIDFCKKPNIYFHREGVWGRPGFVVSSGSPVVVLFGVVVGGGGGNVVGLVGLGGW